MYSMYVYSIISALGTCQAQCNLYAARPQVGHFLPDFFLVLLCIVYCVQAVRDVYGQLATQRRARQLRAGTQHTHNKVRLHQLNPGLQSEPCPGFLCVHIQHRARARARWCLICALCC